MTRPVPGPRFVVEHERGWSQLPYKVKDQTKPYWHTVSGHHSRALAEKAAARANRNAEAGR